MKICWDNLDGVHLSRNNTFRKGEHTYVYRESCKKCGDPYLVEKSKQSKFCSFPCAQSGENNHSYGKVYTTEERKRISITTKGKNNPMYGKIHTFKTRKKMSEKNSVASISNWKDGIKHPGLTSYESNKDTLGLYEDIRKQENTDVLEVKCAYCGKWFAPVYDAVVYRRDAVNSLDRGEGRLYCSETCKQACPTFNQKKYPKGFKHITSREIDPYLRQMVFERDDWLCQICGRSMDEVQLHCHHMDPAIQNPLFQNDMDSCITLCKNCHKSVHKRYGCRYIDLRCRNKNEYIIVNRRS